MLQFPLFVMLLLGPLGSSPNVDQAPKEATVRQLISTFASNDAAADEYFLDKEVIVTGQWRSITRFHLPEDLDPDAKTFYAMEMEVGNASMKLILIFGEEQRKELADLQTDQLVKVVGTCRRMGRSLTIEMVDCKFAK